MPWSNKQKRLFQGIKHGSIPPKRGLSQGKAAKLLSHGAGGSSSRAARKLTRKV